MRNADDTKVLELQFENKDFEKNATQSISTIEKLKESLDFTDSTKGLEDINSNIKAVNFSNLTRGIKEATNGFSMMEVVAFGVFNRLGGRIAESLIFDDITTGASADIKQATSYARAMVTKYGFSDAIGMVNYDSDSDEVFIGRDLAHQRAFSENTQGTIDAEVTAIISHCYDEAKRILTENMEVLHACAALLIEKERISREEFEALFTGKSSGDGGEKPLINDIALDV